MVEIAQTFFVGLAAIHVPVAAPTSLDPENVRSGQKRVRLRPEQVDMRPIGIRVETIRQEIFCPRAAFLFGKIMSAAFQLALARKECVKLFLFRAIADDKPVR